MIIYGWGNFNRRDHSVVRGPCPSCGRSGHQRSYTSSRFFTLYFIPIIPIGKQRVLRDCPHCKQALGMSFGKWSKLKRTEIPALVASYRENPTNAEAAKNLLGTIFAVQDRTTLREVGPQIRSAFSKDADVLTHLAGTYSHLCLDKEADETYLAAVALSEDESISKEADLHLQLQQEPRPQPHNRLLQSLPVLIVPAALLFLASFWLQRSFSSDINDAYVVNGLDRPYSVIINGETITLRPHQRIRGEMLVSGANAIAPVGDSPFITPEDFTIDVPWHERAFGGPVVVVNPDRAAVMLWEKNGYAYPNAPDDAYDMRLGAGRAVYTYDDIDFVFADFPDTIDMPHGVSIAYRERISVLTGYGLLDIVQALVTNEQTEDLQGHLRAVLNAGANDTTSVHLGATFLPADEFMALAERRLEARPVEIEWHRAYQRLAENSGTSDLERKYRDYCAAEPENSALAYLLGRIVDDPAESRQILEHATELPNRTGYAANALAYHFALEGDYATARHYADTACALAPDSENFAAFRMTALHGCKDFALIEQERGDILADGVPAWSDVYDHIYCLAKLGRSDEARTEIQRYLAACERNGGLTDENRHDITAYLDMGIAYALRDRDAFAAVAARMEGATWLYQRAVLDGDLDSAIAHAKDNPEIDLYDHMLLYVLLSRQGDATAAGKQLERVVALLSEGSSDQRRWARWFSDEAPPDVSIAAHTTEEIDSQFIYLTALAARHPEKATEYLQRARAIQARDSFYTLALDGAL